MPDSALAGCRVLIVEDDYFWAEELQRGLQRAGAVVLGPVASVEAALNILDSHRAVDGVLLNIDLRGTCAYPVADWLLDRAVPFLFVTGYDRADLPAFYATLPRLEKPSSVEAVLRALATLLARA